MTWFRADDRLSASRKVLSMRRGVRLQAMGLWVLAGTWSAGEELDGFVPDYMVEELGGSDDVAAVLVASGLWAEAEGGWQFTKWAEYQPSRVELEERRERERERKADWRRRKADKAGSGSEVVPLGQANDETGSSRRSSRVMSHGTDDVTESSVQVTSALTLPDPTRPDPTPVTTDVVTGGGPRKRGCRIPDQFVVTSAMREWAAERTPLVDVDTSTERFVNHWRAKPGKDATKLDWIATWRNWLIRDQDDRAARQKQTPIERAAATVAAGRRLAGNVTSLALPGGAS
ncbi:hypothetical protein A9Z40_02995 [Microbacterium arborescens]|uniref:Uncharacterized protein n=1 Tax=Microbacterium arborescens TaxID=33883 RepID=A0ABX2WI97_9MICO|nr:hypothetical protein [Microbacterium arborescens]OAZ40923.1 hypothetical protein A9Z40_02995 [Microbacterium arborescens]